jgi:hypothetical protein
VIEFQSDEGIGEVIVDDAARLMQGRGRSLIGGDQLRELAELRLCTVGQMKSRAQIGDRGG